MPGRVLPQLWGGGGSGGGAGGGGGGGGGEAPVWVCEGGEGVNFSFLDLYELAWVSSPGSGSSSRWSSGSKYPPPGGCR